MRSSMLPAALVLAGALASPLAAAPQGNAGRGGATRKAGPVTEAQALSLLSNAIEKDAVYAPMALACMTLVVEERAPDAFRIAVREKHGGRCGGDPQTAPVLDRVKIDRATGAISVYDVLDQDYYTWAEFKKHRSGQGQ